MDKQQILKQLSDVRDFLRQRFDVQELIIFGSVARDEATEGSDLDVLVEFNQPATFDRYMDLKFYLEELVGCGVDLVTRHALRPQMQQRVEREAIRVS